MSEIMPNEEHTYANIVQEELRQNENLTCSQISNNKDDLNNILHDSKLNASTCSEDETCSAPVEVLSEFLSTFMSRDYKSALYYCKLILQYEPDNEIVKDFYPLILEKIELDSRESDEFADNEASSYSTKSETSTEYFSSASAGTENTSLCSSFSSDEEASIESSK